MAEVPALVSLKSQLKKRGTGSIKDIGRKFRILDDDGNHNLSFEEFYEGLVDFGLTVTEAEARELFNYFDKDSSGSIAFDEFLVGVRPTMSKSRKEIIDRAFKKMDATGDGVITVQDLKGVYSAKEHPKYKNGEWDEKKVFEEFLKTFEEPNKADGKITKEEFYNYYCGVSASVDSDIYFITMVNNSWKLS